MSKLQDKFQALARSLNAQYGERDEVIEGMVCAALAGEHVLLLGPPGTAKSALARSFTSGIHGAEYFEWLLSKFSAPEELFGPISLSGLERDEYRRVVAGKLPEAHIAFLDEIFKANSAILNSLLTAINERKFHNGGQPLNLPLRMVVGASNELPDGPELAALYDRFLVRFWVDYIANAKLFTAMLSAPAVNQTPHIELADWDEAHTEVLAVVFPAELGEAFYKLRGVLGGKGIKVSDRRWKRCVTLVKAAAWLAGETVVDTEHLAILRAALWQEPEQISEVGVAVDAEVGGAILAAQQVIDTLKHALRGVPLTEPTDKAHLGQWQSQIIGANREVNKGLKKLEEIRAQAPSVRTKEKLGGIVKRAMDLAGPVRAAARSSLEI